MTTILIDKANPERMIAEETCPAGMRYRVDCAGETDWYKGEAFAMKMAWEQMRHYGDAFRCTLYDAQEGRFIPPSEWYLT